MSKIHFSIDDVFGCLNWLAKNQNKVHSIFDSYVFDFARQIHDEFGISVSLYCMYTNGMKNLKDIPDKWKIEFQENSEWLKFGFHAYEPNSCYSDVTPKTFESEYDEVLCELLRIMGGTESLTDTIRLHYFAGNQETVKILAQKGIKCLLCADDDRMSYNLNEDKSRQLKEQRIYYDTLYDMKYVPTDIRVENIRNIDDEIEKARKLESNVVIFTHEIQLAKDSIRNTTIKLLNGIINS